MSDGTFYDNAERFVQWLERRVIEDARGDRDTERSNKPADRYWLGRLATEAEARRTAASDRIMRLDPCAVGFTFQPAPAPPWRWDLTFRCHVWHAEGKKDDRRWFKSAQVVASVSITIDGASFETRVFGEEQLRQAFISAGAGHHAARIDVETRVTDSGRPVVTLTLVNQSPEAPGRDANLYEVSLEAHVGTIEPFVLDALRDSFRYDRSIDAYGVNCGVEYDDDILTTTDFVCADKNRPIYWDDALGLAPDLTFHTLSHDPLTSLGKLMDSLERWVEINWSSDLLDSRAVSEGWSIEMSAEAAIEAKKAREEVARCRSGLAALANPNALKSFKLMNRAFVYSGAGRYEAWRPFQIGFLLASLSGVIGNDDEARLEVSTLWFATGGGKTETYLAAIVLAAFYDRLTGKTTGITAWSRFPLRMLSLQQTQRFADALAGAERVRREEAIGGEPISLGYFVGNSATPNRVRQDPKDWEADADDATMPARYRVLIYCPFCRSEDIRMSFDESIWRLQHECGGTDCPWPGKALPFYVVDEELYRFLPTVVVGTLDKAASVAIQAAMRGFYASPLGLCEGPSHGFTYALRSSTPNGCLVPGCQYPGMPVAQQASVFAPRLRIQDELHLLADSLGAIDSHYETLLDHLTESAGGRSPKLLASSATLAGFSAQVRTLYMRDGSAFPLPGPKESHSFWTQRSPQQMRRYVALAPRGQTQEFANDRIAEAIQVCLREFSADPTTVAAEAGISPSYADDIISFYGVHVIYGSKLRDVEGVARSLESQPPAEPTNVVTLVGSTALADVLKALQRLQKPEPLFLDRLHIVCASSMMSHGVDVDRFNIMTMMGMPLSTAEFIQTTARIGRKFPGLVFVLHRMAVERDAKLFRSFGMFVAHGDRLIEPVAVTRSSRRVLERTAPGMFMADVLGLYEPEWVAQGNKPLTTPKELRKFVRTRENFDVTEAQSMADALCIDLSNKTPIATQLESFVDELVVNINDPATPAKFTSQVVPGKVLISLRDVEERIPIREAVE